MYVSLWDPRSVQEGGWSLWASQAMWRMGFKGALRASGWGLGAAELHIMATSRFPGTPHMLPMPPAPQTGLAPVRTDQMLGEAWHPEGYIPDLNYSHGTYELCGLGKLFL